MGRRLTRRDDPIEAQIARWRELRTAQIDIEESILLGLVEQAKAQSKPAGGFYTVNEVAEKLKRNPVQIYRMVKNGELPHERMGRSVRIPIHAIEAMVNSAA